jgi:hypothetical protein
MRPMGFSFPCPCPAKSEDKAFERFIKTAQKEPSKIYNPFPLLAGLKTYRQARTQPLMRTMYLPTSCPYICDRFGLEEQLTYNHEKYHLENDFTPAKMFARLLLRDTLCNLWPLLEGFSWDSEMEKCWNAVVKNNGRIWAICRSITLAEELLAIAASFEACRRSYDLGALGEKEREIMATHTKLSPHFQAFKKAMLWVRDVDSLLGWLEIYLQGTKLCRQRTCDEWIHIVDSEQRCRILTENINTMSNGNELLDWLLRMSSKRNELVSFSAAWQILVNNKNLDYIDKFFWILMRGRPKDGEVEEVNLDFVPTKYFELNRVEAFLYPVEFNGEWYITYSILSHNESPAEVDALYNILGFASLLEQLTSGNGICCPHYHPLEGCHCYPDWREALNRILQWAREGKFGYGGIWRDLQPECRRNS